MKTRTALFSSLAALLFAAAGAGGGFWYANMRAEMAEYDKQAKAPTPPGKKVLYWHDPMVPQQKFDKPGKSPFMDMQLVPVYADDDAGADGTKDGTKAGIKVNPAAAQSLGARTADAKRAMLSRSIEAVGTVAFDESAVEVVQARVSGWIEKLHVRTPNDPVAAGAPLASIYAPDWLGAQEEYLAVKKSGSADLIGAARARLAHLGIPETQIAALERDGRANPRVTLTAPRGGVLLPLSADMSAGAAALSGQIAPQFATQFAKEGMQVAPGMTLFRIASLASVWVLAEVPEAQSGSLRAGNPAEVRVPAFTDRSFKGAVAVLLPEVNPATRTVRARIRVDNPGGRLLPGMFAAVRLGGGDKREAVVVPTEAVIATGVRKLVMIAGAGGRFAQREVETGMEARIDGVDVTEIRRGVEAGEKVVVSGQFLFDSEASLKSAGTSDAMKSGSGSGSQGNQPNAERKQ